MSTLNLSEFEQVIAEPLVAVFPGPLLPMLAFGFFFGFMIFAGMDTGAMVVFGIALVAIFLATEWGIFAGNLALLLIFVLGGLVVLAAGVFKR